MYTNSTNRRSSFRYKGFTIALIVSFLLILFFSYNSHNLVLAQSGDTNSQDVDIKEIVYGTDSELERSSRRPKLLHIKKGEYVYKIFTVETDIYKILDQYKIYLDGEYRIILSSEYVTNGSLVRVIKTESVIEEIVSDIPFDVNIIKTDKYLKGEEYIAQEGVLGIKKERVLSYYEDGLLIESTLLSENITREPVAKVLEVGTSLYSLTGIDPKGYNCDYWYSVVDSGPYSDEERRWLKFIMYCESGCNAESNKGSYKGLFQWSPTSWSKQFAENIFDGHAQIRNTISKYRAGESTRSNQWPACHARYVRTYGTN
jgi:hypothetical protein